MKKVLLLLSIASSTSVFAAVQKTTIKNNSQQIVSVIGFGTGCAGIVLGKTLACGTEPIIMKPAQSVQIKYTTDGGVRLVIFKPQGNIMYYDLYEAKAGNASLPSELIFSEQDPGLFRQIAR